MIEFLLFLVGFLFVVVLITFATFLKALLGIQFKRGSCELRDKEELPPYLVEPFTAYEDTLTGLGFEFSHIQIVDSLFVNDYSKKWTIVLQNSAEAAYAIVSPSDLPDPGDVCSVEFVTIFKDEFRLITVNGLQHRIICEMPRADLNDPYAESLAKQWEAHREGRRKMTDRSPAGIESPGEFVEYYRRFLEQYNRSLREKGAIKEVKGGATHLTLASALASAWKMFGGEGKYARMKEQMQKAERGAIGALAVPVELEVESYRRMNYNMSQGRDMGKLTKTAMLLITMVFFALSFKMLMSFESLIILVVVLFLHESGHFLGMYLFKYKDLKILFLPFLGAATIGVARKAKPYQKIIVSFLGPVPGIFLGLVLFALFPGSKGYLREGIIMLLALNYLNLLPMMPLDGGQLFNIFMARFPYFQVVFQIISAILLTVVFGLLLQMPIIIVIGFFLIINGISRISSCSLLKKLRENLAAAEKEIGEEAILAEIFSLIKGKPYDTMFFSKKYNIARALRESFIADSPSTWLIVGSILFYLALFFIPPLFYIMWLIIRSF